MHSQIGKYPVVRPHALLGVPEECDHRKYSGKANQPISKVSCIDPYVYWQAGFQRF